MKRPNKYGAKRTVVDGISFASKLEADRYGELKLLERAGVIAHLSMQPRFPLYSNRGTQIGRYVGDFQYVEKNHQVVVEDAKGVETRDFKRKWKHVQADYPNISFRIVKREQVRRAA